MTGTRISEGVRIPVEQALARGEAPETIAQRQQLPLATVLAVRTALDRLNAERDAPAPKPKPRTLQPCGTRAAYERHRRKKEPIDAACRRAKYLYSHVTA